MYILPLIQTANSHYVLLTLPTFSIMCFWETQRGTGCGVYGLNTTALLHSTASTARDEVRRYARLFSEAPDVITRFVSFQNKSKRRYAGSWPAARVPAYRVLFRRLTQRHLEIFQIGTLRFTAGGVACLQMPGWHAADGVPAQAATDAGTPARLEREMMKGGFGPRSVDKRFPRAGLKCQLAGKAVYPSMGGLCEPVTRRV